MRTGSGVAAAGVARSNSTLTLNTVTSLWGCERFWIYIYTFGNAGHFSRPRPYLNALPDAGGDQPNVLASGLYTSRFRRVPSDCALDVLRVPQSIKGKPKIEVRTISGAAPGLIVDDELSNSSSAQMKKSEFLE